MPKSEKNPPGFAKRLDALMQGWGYSSRDIAKRTTVSHMTIENWLADKHQAGPEQVAEVARLFNWTFAQLYAGEVPSGIMDRVAELDGFRQRALRLASGIVGTDFVVGDASSGFTSIPKRSSGQG